MTDHLLPPGAITTAKAMRMLTPPGEKPGRTLWLIRKIFRREIWGVKVGGRWYVLRAEVAALVREPHEVRPPTARRGRPPSGGIPEWVRRGLKAAGVG